MKMHNFTISGARLMLVARTEGKSPVFDLCVEESALDGMTFDQLRLELCTIRKEIDDLLSSHDVEQFNRDWNGMVPINDGKGGFTWGYPCDEKSHAD